MHPDHQAPLNVLDLGTGSGCLLIAFLANYPRANGVGVDASERTLDYARRNAARHNLEARCEFRAGGWLNAWDMTFDVIFANPPYLSETELETCAPEIKIYEPQSAFAAGRDGLEAMRALGPALSRQLATGGTGFVEIGRGQAAAVAQILVGSGLEVRRVAPDLSGEPRCLVIGRAEESGYQAPRNQLEKGG
jgi:release factor glutamine methyltransferase